MKMTITEALAEIKTTQKRIGKKRETVGQYLVRQEKFKDPLDKDGGSRQFVAAERQSIGDLEQRIVTIRRAIQAANATETISINGTTRTIGDWLTWKREIAPGVQQFLAGLQRGVQNVRAEAAKKGLSITSEGQATKPDDIIVNVNEVALASDIDGLETTLGALDGQLSLKNATVMVEV